MKRVTADRVVGCILAGGRSVRMGRDKAMVDLGGRPLVEWTADRMRPQVGRLVVNANEPPGDCARLGLAVIADTIPGHAGPLAGILAALRHAETVAGASHVATAAVDAPFLPANLVARLSAALAAPTEVALAASAGRVHPVFGLWPVSMADRLEAWLQGTADFSVRAWTGRCATAIVDFAMEARVDPFFNINTQDDLAEAARILASGV